MVFCIKPELMGVDYNLNRHLVTGYNLKGLINPAGMSGVEKTSFLVIST